jgi:predicted TPR repeat methyltransferase
VEAFIYLGRLGKVFALIYQRLKVGDKLLFSIEKTTGVDTRAYQLNISGRYSHHHEYLATILGIYLHYN